MIEQAGRSDAAFGSHRFQIGVSTGALHDRWRWDDLLAFKPEIIEFYNFPSAALQRIRDFCSTHTIIAALHTPVPYDKPYPHTRFAPTGPCLIEAEEALELTLNTIECAKSLDARHVVVHFPSPYPTATSQIHRERIDAFLAPVARASVEKGVTVLIENMSSHPSFCLPLCYGEVLRRYPQIGLCLDFDHADQLAPKAAIEDFIYILGDKIRSCHIKVGFRKGGRATGCMRKWVTEVPRCTAILDLLLRRGIGPSLIIEPFEPLDRTELREAAEWTQHFRRLADRKAAPFL